ncbi:NADP-dependent 3-hydroxy acid dehydrogenase YdfG [Neobacillus sp. B4I6]
MVKQNYGRIINIGADSVRNGLWDHAAYNAAKGGGHAIFPDQEENSPKIILPRMSSLPRQ